MQVLIDISEDISVVLSRMGLLRIPDEMIKVVNKAIQCGIPFSPKDTEDYDSTPD